MATIPLPNEPLDSQQVYSATYSNVPVYEFLTPNGSVMRRKSDGWVNATHILKVANFPKLKRTRILEKDVQTGVHEKVQGGYGKYQGTWVPLERAMEIADIFEVNAILAPLFYYTREEGAQSPPPAPKHHNASSKASKMLSLNLGLPLDSTRLRTQPKDGKNDKSTNSSKLNSVSSKKSQSNYTTAAKLTKTDSVTKKRGRPPKLAMSFQLHSSQDQQVPQYSPPPQLPPIVNSLPKPDPDYRHTDSQYLCSPEQLDDHRMIHHPSSSPSDFMSDTDLAAALRSPDLSFQGGTAHQQQQQQYQMQRRQHFQLLELQQQLQQLQQRSPSGFGKLKTHDEDDEIHPPWYQAYRNSLLEYFHTPDDGLTDTPLPSMLVNPPAGFDINYGVDKENNTALHWACAVGDLKMIEALLQCGANANITNNDGLIPIMRSVLFTNPYERRTFAKLLDLFRESLLGVSVDGKTILHLIAMSTNSKIRLNAAKYYMEMLLGKISLYHLRDTVVNYVNRQDHEGNTALHYIYKSSVKKYLKIFLAYGARIDIANKHGERIEDYLEQDLIENDVEQRHFPLSQPQQANPIAINPYYQAFNTNNNNDHLQSVSLTTSIPRILPVPHYSELAIQANQVVANQLMDGLDELANAYDNELQLKEEEIGEVRSMINSLTLEINDIEHQLGKAADIKEIVESKTQEYEVLQVKLKKVLERAQSKDLATLVQLSEQELSNGGDHQDQSNEEKFDGILTLTLYQHKRQKLVEKMLLTISSNQNYKIDKYKYLMRLCLKGSLDENGAMSLSQMAAGGDTDDDDAPMEDVDVTKNKNGVATKFKVSDSEEQKLIDFESDDVNEDLLLDILIDNLDPL